MFFMPVLSLCFSPLLTHLFVDESGEPEPAARLAAELAEVGFVLEGYFLSGDRGWMAFLTNESRRERENEKLR